MRKPLSLPALIMDKLPGPARVFSVCMTVAVTAIGITTISYLLGTSDGADWHDGFRYSLALAIFGVVYDVLWWSIMFFLPTKK